MNLYKTVALYKSRQVVLYKTVTNYLYKTVTNYANNVKRAATPFSVPNLGIFGRKQFNISSAKRSVPFFFDGSTPYARV